MSLHHNIQRTQFTVGDFVSWMRNGELELSPSFQRRSVWPPRAKSYLVDTVVRGLPMPIVFLRERTDIKTLKTIREVVDGQQRIRTLLSFVDPQSLRDLNPDRDVFTVSKLHNKEVAGKRFPDFDDELKQNVLSYQIPSHVFRSDTSDDQILDIFRRMNATGIKLNDQELRNSEFFGSYIQAVYRLSNHNLARWRKWKLFSEQDIARMQEAEFVSELFGFILHGIQEKKQSLIRDDYLAFDEDFPSGGHVEERVQNILDKLDASLGEIIPNSRFSNRIVFYPLFATVYDHIYGIGGDLGGDAKPFTAEKANALKRAAQALQNYEDLPEAVLKALSGQSNKVENRTTIKNYLAGFLA